MSIAVNFTEPFNIPQGPDFHDTYYVDETVALSWALPANVSVSLHYTNDTDQSFQQYTWTLLSTFSWIYPSFRLIRIASPMYKYKSLIPVYKYLENQTNQNFLFWQLDPSFIKTANQGRLRLWWYPGGPGYGWEQAQSAWSPKFHVEQRQSTSAEVGVGIVVPIGVLLIVVGVWWFFMRRTCWGFRMRKRESREVVR